MADTVVTYPIRGNHLQLSLEVRERLFYCESAYQRIEVLDTEIFGRALFLDGHIQLAEFDEHAYHEALVHIPLLSLVDASRALVVGGGDGGVLRELCRYPTIDRIDMVEIDQQVIEVCLRFLPNVSAGAFDDPRVGLTVGDAFQFVREDHPPYDLIVLDVTDLYEHEEGELSAELFGRKFYQDCERLLSPSGVLVTQADNHVFCPTTQARVLTTFNEMYAFSGHYQALVPSFGGFSGFCWASNGSPLAVLSEPDFSKLAFRYLNEDTYRLAFSPLHF